MIDCYVKAYKAKEYESNFFSFQSLGQLCPRRHFECNIVSRVFFAIQLESRKAEQILYVIRHMIRRFNSFV